MEYTRLGNSGLQVSRITVGCMSWGDGGQDRPWTKDEAFAEQTIKAALDAGVNFFDTANVYSAGTSEEYTGRSLWKHADREDVVLATKVHGRMRPGPNGAGLSRKAILQEIDASLARLGTDYVDLYQIHRFDPRRPIEETMEALHDVVRAGKARYLGASSMYAWQFAKMQHAAERNGWTQFVSMQNHYNLIYREEEREMLPLCADQGVGVIPWSPLARGRLTRPWDTQTARSETDEFGASLYRDEDQSVVDKVLARRRAARRRAGPGRRWRGCSRSRRSPHRSSASPGPSTSPTRSPRSTSSSPTTRSPSSATGTCRTRSRVTGRASAHAGRPRGPNGPGFLARLDYWFARVSPGSLDHNGGWGFVISRGRVAQTCLWGDLTMMRTRRFLGAAAAGAVGIGLLLPMEAAHAERCHAHFDNATTARPAFRGDCTLTSTEISPGRVHVRRQRAHDHRYRWCVDRRGDLRVDARDVRQPRRRR